MEVWGQHPTNELESFTPGGGGVLKKGINCQEKHCIYDGILRIGAETIT